LRWCNNSGTNRLRPPSRTFFRYGGRPSRCRRREGPPAHRRRTFSIVMGRKSPPPILGIAREEARHPRSWLKVHLACLRLCPCRVWDVRGIPWNQCERSTDEAQDGEASSPFDEEVGASPLGHCSLRGFPVPSRCYTNTFSLVVGKIRAFLVARQENPFSRWESNRRSSLLDKKTLWWGGRQTAPLGAGEATGVLDIGLVV